MMKLFKRREFLRRETRTAIEWFGFAWVIRSWFDPGWGGAGTWLWWLNMVLSGIVVIAALLVLWTKPKHEPTFDEQLKAHLKRNDLRLITNEMAAKLPSLITGIPIVESPFVPKGQFFAVNPNTLADIIAKASSAEMFKVRAHQEPRPFFGEDAAAVAEHLNSLSTARCVHRWDDDHACPMEYPGHRCNRTVGLHGRECTCRCGATAAYAVREDGSIDETFGEPT